MVYFCPVSVLSLWSVIYNVIHGNHMYKFVDIRLVLVSFLWMTGQPPFDYFVILSIVNWINPTILYKYIRKYRSTELCENLLYVWEFFLIIVTVIY